MIINKKPGKPLRYDNLDHVVVTTTGRNGSQKLHAFVRMRENKWRLFTPPSAKQLQRYNQLLEQMPNPADRVVEGTWSDDDQQEYAARRERMHDAYWPSSGDVHFRDELGEARVDLGDGVTPQGSTLSVILEALYRAGRTEVDRDDLKVVLSQLGSRITQLDKLSDEQQRQAQGALHAQIVGRCTTL